MNGLVQRIFHLICQKDSTLASDNDAEYFHNGLDETDLYFHRLGNKVDYVGKKVLDVGCGHGATCIYVACHGAREAIGIDIQEHRIEFAKAMLRTEYSDLANKVDFKVVAEPKQLEGQKFDIILSKDSFEHIENPERYVQGLEECVADDGIIAIGFSPLWKSPYGGHIGFMTSFPWAHLLFPESVIMRERKRFRPDEKAEKFEQVKGGLNKMTLEKFMNIMKNSNLETLYFKTNVHDRKLTKLFNILSCLPFSKEYFTFNLYSIWRVKASSKASSTVKGNEYASKV